MPHARTFATAPAARTALDLVTDLQARFVKKLESTSNSLGHPVKLSPVSWLRDEGRHGGGERYEAPEGEVFNRGSVNVSQVHYDDDSQKRLGSATALSTIIHPAHPRAPSVHMHVSWTQMRDGEGYWRVMADLNPSLENGAHAERFEAALRAAAPEVYPQAQRNGDAYFEIPALGRHRGVRHFYLEGLATDDPDADRALARRVIEAGIDVYVEILGEALRDAAPPTEAERQSQLAYHTLYLFQVLTLDRGTTSGLLVHDQNDLGTMGSLPARVDRSLLASWAAEVVPAQVPLVRALAAALPDQHPAPVGDAQKLALARATREHYRAHPEALEHQAPVPEHPPGRGHA